MPRARYHDIQQWDYECDLCGELRDSGRTLCVACRDQRSIPGPLRPSARHFVPWTDERISEWKAARKERDKAL